MMLDICWACGEPATGHGGKVTIKGKSLHMDCLFRAAKVEQLIKEKKNETK